MLRNGIPGVLTDSSTLATVERANRANLRLWTGSKRSLRTIPANNSLNHIDVNLVAVFPPALATELTHRSLQNVCTRTCDIIGEQGLRVHRELMPAGLGG